MEHADPDLVAQAAARDRLLSDASLLAELAPVGMFSADEKGAVLHGNAQWVEMLGADALSELTGFQWADAIHPEDLDALGTGWQEAVRAGQPYSGIFRTREGAGRTVRWIRFRARKVGPGLAPIAFVGTAVDVTSTVLLERELQHKNRLLARALEASGLGMWEIDLRSGQLHLSPGWMRMLKAPDVAEVLQSRDATRFFPPGEMERVLEGRRQLLKGEIAHLSLEHQMRANDGSLLWVLTEAEVTERGPDGRALYVVGTSKDITERKRADAELRSALQAADGASQAKSDFLATMSHEIRTPLNGVIGLTQLLAGAELPPMEKDSVRMIDSCAKSLLSIVDNILDFSKIEAGRLTLDPVPTDLKQLVEEVADVFSVRASEKGIRFDLRQDEDVPRWICADPGRLRQILLNLLGNALKFTTEGGFSLHVSVSDSGQLRFQVFDTGIGISDEDQARLFTRFSQVDASASRRHDGSGLGLAISRQLAQLMGGDVALVSRLGHGSTFTVSVPLQAVPAPAQEVRPAAHAVREDVRILLAEDNEVNQLVAQRLLAKLGYPNVTVAFTGREAVEACRAARYDLVLMDCQMPVMDGLDASRALREQGMQAPIIAFTASATSGDRDRCLAAGMNDYLAKPVEMAVLADKLHRWLGGPPPPPPAVAPSPARAKAAAVLADFDPDAIVEHFYGDLELFQQAREIFLRQTRDGLVKADAMKDGVELQRLAHRIRGSAATLGAMALAATCQRLEEEATQLTPAQMHARVQEAVTRLDAFVVLSMAAVAAS